MGSPNNDPVMSATPGQGADYVAIEVDREDRVVRRLREADELRLAALDLLAWWEDAGSYTAVEGADRWDRLRAAAC